MYDKNYQNGTETDGPDGPDNLNIEDHQHPTKIQNADHI